MNKVFTQVRDASRCFAGIPNEIIDKVLLEIAAVTEKESSFLLEENCKDLARMNADDPKYDRLKLTRERILGIAQDMRNVANLESPVGKILEHRTMDNGLIIDKVTVPMGVVGIIYEARPNVTFDVFALCFKSSNACILKGGSDASYSNDAIISVIKGVLKNFHINESVVELLPSDRLYTKELLEARGYVDVIIPRGSQGLIDYVVKNAQVPVIETGAGIVHTYLDESGKLDQAREIILNAKTRRVSVCNSLDCLIVHRHQLANLPGIVDVLATKNVMLYADEYSRMILTGRYPSALLQPATIESFGTEFLSYKMAVKTVDNIDEAIQHIYTYGSRHSEAIISENPINIEKFLTEVDAAVVYVNASTAFTDGAQFGMGAEIGISTQKLHARGPMALPELTTYKWIVHGQGQTRP